MTKEFKTLRQSMSVRNPQERASVQLVDGFVVAPGETKTLPFQVHTHALTKVALDKGTLVKVSDVEAPSKKKKPEPAPVAKTPVAVPAPKEQPKTEPQKVSASLEKKGK